MIPGKYHHVEDSNIVTFTLHPDQPNFHGEYKKFTRWLVEESIVKGILYIIIVFLENLMPLGEVN